MFYCNFIIYSDLLKFKINTLWKKGIYVQRGNTSWDEFILVLDLVALSWSEVNFSWDSGCRLSLQARVLSGKLLHHVYLVDLGQII